MSHYRRYFVAGGTYFFTLKTEANLPVFQFIEPVCLLGDLFRQMCGRWPVTIDAMVLLPDHLHALWTLPPGDFDYSKRWGWIKKEFSKRYVAMGGRTQPISHSRRKNRRLGVWQRRFWEHTVRDEQDFEAHLDYIHWNPVKHGLVRSPRDWPHSTFHRWVDRGVYSEAWGAAESSAGRSAEVRDAGE